MKIHSYRKHHVKSAPIHRYYTIVALVLLFAAGLWLPGSAAAEGKKPMSLQDIMKFKHIKSSAISENGQWVVYSTEPDRGNGNVTVYDVATGNNFSIPLGTRPAISKDSRWVAASVKPDVLEALNADKKKKPKAAMALLETQSGKITTTERVKGFKFSDDSRWLVISLFPEEKKEEKKKDKDKVKEQEKEKPKEKPSGAKKEETMTLLLRDLGTGSDIRIEKVGTYALDPSSRFIVYTLPAEKKEKDEAKKDASKYGLFARNLAKDPKTEITIHNAEGAKYSNLIWSKKHSRMGFVMHENHVDKNKDKDKKKKAATFTSALMLWDGARGKLVTAVSKTQTPPGWVIPKENNLKWTEDGQRLFFGLKPEKEHQFFHPKKDNKDKKEKVTEDQYFNPEQIREKRSLDVWHWMDPLINPQQKLTWERMKNQIYTSVYHYRSGKKGRFVQLTDEEMPDIRIPENARYAIGSSDVPYLREMTWSGMHRDIYVVDLQSGERKKLITRYPHYSGSISYEGNYVLYFLGKDWFLYNTRTKQTRNLTEKLGVPFYNEDHDYPEAVSGYRGGGWVAKDSAVIIYDKYDIWQFSTAGGSAVCLTNGKGRENKVTFRIQKLDPEARFLAAGEPLLLEAFSHKLKNQAFYRGKVGHVGVRKIAEEADKFYRFGKKAKKADRILFTRENFQEFPDLWVSSLELENPKKISHVNPQMKGFLWGKGQVVEFLSADGTPMQGALFLPENWDKKTKLPVFVYYYRFMSQRVHRFNQVVINHRPCFPYYTGHGYAVFLPDIRFEIGRPGLSAVKCLVPGVQKLIEMGVADPRAIGLHGHSWSGYQTAHVVTQTDIFAAAIAGAPVSNMTSAYSGIRWGSGMARQFQYEKSQSRIGPTLVEAPHLYIENSPVFYADRINTPMLIQFGDVDGAVPWYQGIELYLALRRHDKECVFLQYNQEPHHLKKYPNKVDYTIKMMEYFDHYLKGKPAPDWITKGKPYRKK